MRALNMSTRAIDARYSYRGEDVVQTMERICAQTGYPKMIRVDQGSEFISRDLDLWAYANGVTLDFSRPGKPTDNAFIEAFNGRRRAECLNQHWFMSLADAREKLEAWRGDLCGWLLRCKGFFRFGKPWSEADLCPAC